VCVVNLLIFEGEKKQQQCSDMKQWRSSLMNNYMWSCICVLGVSVLPPNTFYWIFFNCSNTVVFFISFILLYLCLVDVSLTMKIFFHNIHLNFFFYSRRLFSKTFKLFTFPIFLFWVYLMKVIPEMQRAH
jgi:hypothetical protein